jgi:hypothetical protein
MFFRSFVRSAFFLPKIHDWISLFSTVDCWLLGGAFLFFTFSSQFVKVEFAKWLIILGFFFVF